MQNGDVWHELGRVVHVAPVAALHERPGRHGRDIMLRGRRRAQVFAPRGPHITCAAKAVVLTWRVRGDLIGLAGDEEIVDGVAVKGAVPAVVIRSENKENR